MKPLTLKQIEQALKKLPSWSVNSKATSLSFVKTFSHHIDALVFIARVTVHAEVLNHHPDISFSYKKVKIQLSTHDAQGVTKKDIELAQKIQTLT